MRIRGARVRFHSSDATNARPSPASTMGTVEPLVPAATTARSGTSQKAPDSVSRRQRRARTTSRAMRVGRAEREGRRLGVDGEPGRRQSECVGRSGEHREQAGRRGGERAAEEAQGRHPYGEGHRHRHERGEHPEQDDVEVDAGHGRRLGDPCVPEPVVAEVLPEDGRPRGWAPVEQLGGEGEVQVGVIVRLSRCGPHEAVDDDVLAELGDRREAREADDDGQPPRDPHPAGGHDAPAGARDGEECGSHGDGDRPRQQVHPAEPGDDLRRHGERRAEREADDRVLEEPAVPWADGPPDDRAGQHLAEQDAAVGEDGVAELQLQPQRRHDVDADGEEDRDERGDVAPSGGRRRLPGGRRAETRSTPRSSWDA